MKKQSLKRIYHTWDKWECYPAGFYEGQVGQMTDEQAKEAYRAFLSDLGLFQKGIAKVFQEWPRSCEHYLTNERMNRVAWIGQAAACAYLGLPSKYRSGYFLLSDIQREEADDLALKNLNKWLLEHGHDAVDLEGAGVSTQVNLY